MKEKLFGLGFFLLFACQEPSVQQNGSGLKAIKDQRSVKVLRVMDTENSLHMGRDFLLYITNQTAETARLPSNTEPGTQANAYNAIPILCGGKGSAAEKNFLSILGLPSLPFYIPELNIGEAESTYNFADRAPLICNGDKDGDPTPCRIFTSSFLS